MNDKIFELEIKKIIHEYNLLSIDEEYKNELINLNKESFLREIASKNNLDKTEEDILTEEEINEPIFSEPIEKKVVSDNIKKLFREIVKITHPDKTIKKNNKKELNDLYISAKKAFDESDIYEILKICDRLSIKWVIDIQEKLVLEENLIKKREKIKSIESSYIWIWITSETQEEKDEIVNNFIAVNGKKIK